MTISRRTFLKAGGLSMLAFGAAGLGSIAAPSFLTRIAEASRLNAPDSKRRKILVTIFQRGAMDGLLAVTPMTDPAIQKYRPLIAVPNDKLINLQNGFGLHPSLEPFARLYQEKRLAIIHGAGSPEKNRSHFDAQDFMENGTPGRKGTADGWLNRTMEVSGGLQKTPSPFQAVSLTAALPLSLYGQRKAIAMSNINEFGVRLAGGGAQSTLASAAGNSFEELYAKSTEELLSGTGKESFEAVKVLSKINTNKYQPENGAVYPGSPLGNSLRQIAQLIKSDLGVEIAFAESAGWDTHVGEVNRFAAQASDLSKSIAAFWSDLQTYQDELVVMTMTEFGRTVKQNGSGGTDHGRGSCFFVLGNKVDGGKVHGSIPASLEPDALEDGRDLPVTTDFRSVFSEVAGKQFSIAAANDRSIFPNWTGKRLPLFTA